MAKVGPKFTYEVKNFDAIISSVTRAKGSLGQVADLNGIPRDAFYHWIRCGEEDRNNCISSELAQLCNKIKITQAEVVIDLCEQAMICDKKAKFITWWLSKICREDFGVEGMELKELRDIFKIILPLLGKGDAFNGEANNKDTQQDS